MVAILNFENHIFARFYKSMLVIPTKLGSNIARGKGHLVHEFDLDDLDFRKWQPF